MEARCSDDGERCYVLARKMEASMVLDVSAEFSGELQARRMVVARLTARSVNGGRRLPW